MSSALRANRIGVWASASVGACVAALACARPARAAVVAHRSETTLSSSNGRGAIAWDATTWRITQFLEHAYQNPTATTQSRNFVFDSYPGVRIGATGTWLSAVEPSLVQYLPGTGIIHAVRALSGYTLDEYDFAPMGLAENASVMLVTVTGAGASAPIDVYSLFNYQVGTGSPTPTSASETVTYDGATGAYYETGPAGVALAYVPVAKTTHHGCSPNNPYALLGSGANLADDSGHRRRRRRAPVAASRRASARSPRGRRRRSGGSRSSRPSANGAGGRSASRGPG